VSCTRVHRETVNVSAAARERARNNNYSRAVITARRENESIVRFIYLAFTCSGFGMICFLFLRTGDGNFGGRNALYLSRPTNMYAETHGSRDLRQQRHNRYGYYSACTPIQTRVTDKLPT